MARNKKVEILSNDKEVLHPMTDGDCVIFEDGQTLTQKLSEDDSVKYTPEIVSSSPMFKVGEGNTVDYSDNVLDGAYERATLQGQTYVNYIQESSADEITLPTPFTEYERTQHNTLTSDEEGTLGINLVGQSYVNALQHDSEEEYVVLGESLEFQEKKVEYTNEGQIKSAMLKGQTLVNLATHKHFWNGYGTAGEDLVLELKNNTKYMFVMNSLENVQCVSLAGDDWHIHQTLMGTEDNGSYKGELVQKKVFTFNVSSPSKVKKIRILLALAPTTTPDYQVMLLEYQDGMENWDIPYFEGMQSVTVSTKLENLCHKYNNGLAKNGKTFNTNSLADRCITFVDYKDGAEAIYGMKPNTKYLVQFQISNLVLDGLSSLAMAFSVGEPNSTNYLFKDSTKTGLITANGVYRVVLTTADVVSTSGVEIKGLATEWEGSGSTLRSMTISNIMYVEYQNGMENWDLPYFEDYQVMKPVQVESIGKNLFDGQLESGNIDTATGAYTTSAERQRTVNFIPVKPNTTYILSNNREVTFGVREYDNNKNYLGWYTPSTSSDTLTSLVITKNSNVAFLKFVVVDTNTDNQIQLEESDTATSYVPHQSKTTYSWDEVILRKVGDVEDTLDLTTGEWVQRIGEIVLDGSFSTTSIIDGAYSLIINVPDKEKENVVAYVSRAICDKCIVRPNIGAQDYDCAIYENPLNYVIFDKTVTSADEFKEKYHGAKFCYPLEKPIVHKVNLSRPNLQVYDDITYVHTKCLDGTLVPNIYLPSDISYPAILEPNTTYNVCVNHTEVSADNPLKVNVSGTEITMTDSRMTLTTPTTLANSNVSFTGKGNKIKESMLIKNSSLLTRDLPHFNGIGSVQLGKTIENLCESTNGYVGNVTINEYEDKIISTVTAAGPLVFTFKLTKQLENDKKYFVYVPNTYPENSQAIVGFYGKYDGKSLFVKNSTSYGVRESCIITIKQQDNPYISLTIGVHGSLPVNTTIELKRPIICEYEPGMENWDWESIGYFTGTKNIGNEFMRIGNKNLFESNNLILGANQYWASQGYEVNIGHTLRATLSQLIQVTPGCTLTLTFGSNYQGVIQEYISDDKRTHYNDGGWQNDIQTLKLNEKTKYVNIYFRKKDDTQFTTDELNALKNSIQLEESSTATTYTARKYNSLYITKDQPIELTWEQGNVNAGANTSWNDAIQNTISKRIRTNLITLKPNTSYRVSLGNKNYMWYLYAFDGNNVCPHPHSFNMKPDGFMQADFIFTTTQQLYKIALVGRKADDTNIIPSEINHIRLEEVTDVVLRGIGDVHDELDITRGIYTQRIGEIVLDGSEEWTTNGSFANGEISYMCGTYTDGRLSSGHVVSDGMVTVLVNLENYESKIDTAPEKFLTYTTGTGKIQFIRKTPYSTIEELKQELSLTNIRVQYELATPIVHKVHIGNKNEANTEVTKPNDVFTLPTLYTEQTHIDLTNNGIIPKVQSRDYIAYPVLPMIGRTYTLQHNLIGGVSNLTVDLLGRTQSVSYQNHKSLIYSPESLVSNIKHRELRISGKGKISRVMYIDGGYMDRDIPYIEGMKNAVNPIVKNVGKNFTSVEGGNTNFFIDRIIANKTYYLYTERSSDVYYNLICFEERNNKSHGTIIKANQNKNLVSFTSPFDGYLYFNGYSNVEVKNVTLSMKELSNYEPYKENICYVDCGEVRLTPDMFEQGNIVYNGANAGATYDSMKQASNIRVRMKELIEIKPNTKYLLNIKGGYKVFVREFDVNKGKLNDSALSLKEFQSRGVFTTNANTQYISLLIGNLSDTSLPLSDFDKFNLLLIEKDNMVILRSLPHGVHDEIDLETGKYIQRVGEITFNGVENWQPGYSSWDNKCTYWNHDFVDIKLMKGDNGSGQAYYDAVRCPQLHRSYMGRLASASIDGVCAYYYSGYQRIFISKQDCATVDELKLWLKENPITVQYELAEPIVKDIVIHNYPHSYEGGHVIIENGDPNTPIPAQLAYRAVTNRSGQIQQHTEQVEKQEREINELETLILANIHLSQTR